MIRKSKASSRASAGRRRKLTILLSNDDGIHAHGLQVLAKELSRIAQVYVVAPMDEKSTTGHSLTLHKPLRIYELPHLGERFYGVSGSPADCVYLALRTLLKNKRPDFVVSGPNRGANLGQDVYYSGTVSAAREAAILGIPSLAVSLCIDFKSLSAKKRAEKFRNYDAASVLARKTLEQWDTWVVPDHTLLNLNVPDLPLERIKGVVPARQGFRHYSGTVLTRKDHRGRDYYWVGGQYQGFKSKPETDCFEVDQGFAALTPLQLDATDEDCLRGLKQKFLKSSFLKSNSKERRK